MPTRYPIIAFFIALTASAAVCALAATPVPPPKFTVPPAATVWIDDLDLSLAAVGYGTTNKGRTTDNRELVEHLFSRRFVARARLDGRNPKPVPLVSAPNWDCGRDERPGHMAFHVFADGERLVERFVVGASRPSRDLTFTGKNISSPRGHGPGVRTRPCGVGAPARAAKRGKSAELVQIVRPLYLDDEGRRPPARPSVGRANREGSRPAAAAREGMRENAATARGVKRPRPTEKIARYRGRRV